MSEFKFNATARRVVAYIKKNPGMTKREIAMGLKMPTGTLDWYIGPIKTLGYIEGSGWPPRYVPSTGAPIVEKPDECTCALVAAMRAMVICGRAAA